MQVAASVHDVPDRLESKERLRVPGQRRCPTLPRPCYRLKPPEHTIFLLGFVRGIRSESRLLDLFRHDH